MTSDYLIEKYIEKTGYGMDMWNKEENAAMTTIAEIILESEVIKLNEPVVSGLLVDFLTWYIHKSEFSKDTYNIKLIVDEYQKLYNMKKIERLKTSRESNFQEETIGQKLSQFRNKLNEIIDYINEKEQMEEYKKTIEQVVDELVSENLDSEDIVIESDEQ